MEGHSEKLQGEKPSIYKRVIYYFPLRQKIKIFNSFITEIFVLKWFLKFLAKSLLKKKILNILFSIKMENKIYYSLSTENFCFLLRL